MNVLIACEESQVVCTNFRNTYVINGTIVIRSYHAYLEYYFEVLRPAGLTTVCVGSEGKCFQLQTVERGKEHEFISQQRIR